MTRTHKIDTAPPTEAPACLGAGGSAERVQRALGVIDGRWKLAILFRLFETPVLRYSELRRRIRQVTPRMLTLHLRELERDGVVARTAHPSVPPKVEYALTDKGRALRPILAMLPEWI